jgi:hypothetical protein
MAFRFPKNYEKAIAVLGFMSILGFIFGPYQIAEKIAGLPYSFKCRGFQRKLYENYKICKKTAPAESDIKTCLYEAFNHTMKSSNVEPVGIEYILNKTQKTPTVKIDILINKNTLVENVDYRVIGYNQRIIRELKKPIRAVLEDKLDSDFDVLTFVFKKK